MRRVLFVIGVGAAVLVQSVGALAAPTPVPALDGILVSPPSADFVEVARTKGVFEGPFDADGYAAITASASVSQVKQDLAGAGFLSGFGRTWFSAPKKHIYVEAVMAFDGAKGAKSWLRHSERSDKADPTYQHPITISGIDSYYGARLADTVGGVFADAYWFVKGNDIFLISTVSKSDDLAATAATQARRQYDSAPAYTVPPAEWPETKAATLVLVGKVAGATAAGILIAGLIVAAVLIARSRRRPPLPAAVAEPPAPDV